MNRACVSILLMVPFLAFLYGEAAGENGASVFDPLKLRLISDGFEKELVEDVYGRNQLKFLPQTVRGYLTYKEKDLNYSQFLTKALIRKGRDYFLEHKDVFSAAYNQYGVTPEIVISLLIVETNLGRYTGKNSVFNVLSSLALAGMLDSVPECPGFDQEFHKKLKKKSEWAYAELKAFLHYTRTNKIDPFSIPGSFAGAFGIPQFIPSSCKSFGADGDGNGVVDLYSHQDAIMSVGNYLRAFGWDENAVRDEKKKVLMHYNRSTYYVETVLELAKRMDIPRRTQTVAMEKSRKPFRSAAKDETSNIN